MERAGALLTRFGIAHEALPEVAGSCAGPLVIVGSGRSVWADLHDAPEGDCMAVNDAIMHVPKPLKHAYSNAAEMLPHWLGARREDLKKRDKATGVHHCRTFWQSGHYWPWPGHGTSTLNAVYTGIALGYSPIVICGVPLDNTGHYFDPPWRGNPDYKGERRYWQSVADILTGCVYGMSGYLAELLGKP